MKIFVDGKFAGNISRDEYSSVISAAWRQVWRAQLVNTFGCALRVLQAMIVTVPLVAFWSIALGVFVNPELLSREVISIIQSPGVFVATSRRLLPEFFGVAAMLCVAAISVRAFFGLNTFGFKDYVAEEVHDRIRGRIGYAGVGRVTVEDAMPAPAVAP